MLLQPQPLERHFTIPDPPLRTTVSAVVVLLLVLCQAGRSTFSGHYSITLHCISTYCTELSYVNVMVVVDDDDDACVNVLATHYGMSQSIPATDQRSL